MSQSKYSLAFIEDVYPYSGVNSVNINKAITAGSPTPTLGFEDFICLENHALEIPWWSDLVNGIEKPVIQDGHIKVPEKPGLGVELMDQQHSFSYCWEQRKARETSWSLLARSTAFL
jgi:L-alanine-DL-glutamate epimerase-like enolase superfamily enzyme